MTAVPVASTANLADSRLQLAMAKNCRTRLTGFVVASGLSREG